MKTMTVKINRPSKVRISGGSESSVHVLKEENSRLRTDISRLRVEKARFREENSQLRAENSQLRAHNSQLGEELHFVREELKEEREMSELKDIELARGNALYQMLHEEHLRASV